MIVSNTGPLISLARVGRLDLLKRYYNEIYIPREVYEEIVIRGQGKAGCDEVKRADWIVTKEVRDKFAVRVLELDIEKGEAEAIVLAKELNAELVLMDERIPREMLKTLGFKVVGTVGILIKAAKEGLLDLKESLDDLRNKGFWLSDDVYELALKMVEDNKN
jgi:predicted nucleic acid-binding protein